MPPHLAGRKPAQDQLRDALGLLQQGKGAHRDFIIIGPRGNGKTVLMRWFEGLCIQEGTLDVVWLTPDQVPDLNVLATELAPPERFRDWLPTSLSLSLGPRQLRWELGERPNSLTRLLTARCQKRPLALLLDEAHTLNPEIGQTLLNASQQVSAKAPFLLALAGTPGLEYQLNKMSATFWGRSKKLSIGRLDDEGARAALVKPFELHEITFAGAALDQVIDESQRYPYFLQCWGNALANVLQSLETPTGQATRQIDMAIVAAARPVFEEERIGHYEVFRGQIAEAGLQSLAAAVTLAYAYRDTLEEHLLDAAIGQALHGAAPLGEAPSAVEIINQRKALASFGYIWKPPDSADEWLAGVPSLMQHVLEIEQKSRPSTDTTGIRPPT